MKHTRIVVRVGRTQNLENYSNVRPEIELEAVLEEGDIPDICKARLRAEATEFLEEYIDEALEQEDRPAKFWRGPRFRVLRTQEVWLDAFRRQFKVSPPERLVLIVPEWAELGAGDAAPKGRRWHAQPHHSRQALRLEHARRYAHECLAQRDGHDYRLIDCADGDLSQIPAWVFEPVSARHSPEELAAVRAAEWYEDHLGLGTRAGVVEVRYDFQADAYMVTLWAEGVEGTRVVLVRHDEAPRFVGGAPAPAPAYPFEEGDDEEGDDDED